MAKQLGLAKDTAVLEYLTARMDISYALLDELAKRVCESAEGLSREQRIAPPLLLEVRCMLR